MQNHTLVALGVSMFALMAVSFYFTVRAYRRKQKPKEQRDDVTLHVRLGAKPHEVASPVPGGWKEVAGQESTIGLTNEQITWALRQIITKWENVAHQWLDVTSPAEADKSLNFQYETVRDLRIDLRTTQAERDNFKALWEQARKEREEQFNLRQEADTKVLLLQQGKYITECERDEARALANDLREYLDRALKIVNEQNQQLYKLSGAWRHNQRNADGTFKRKTTAQLVGGSPAEHLDTPLLTGAAPTPVKHLREVNAEQAKKPRPISSVVKQNYAIELNTPEEEAAILNLFEESKVLWSSVKDATKQTHPTPYYISAHRGVLTMQNSRKYWKQKGFIILPASDFLPAVEVQPIDAERPDDSHPGEQEQPADMPPIEPRPDHPCLKGCSKLGACDCPESSPKEGVVEFFHPRKFFVEKGVVNGRVHLDGDIDKIIKWAESVGLEYLFRGGSFGDDRYYFTRPAVNSDFDTTQATQP